MNEPAADAKNTAAPAISSGSPIRRKGVVAVRSAVEAAGWEYESADATFLPSVSVPLDEDGARKVFRLMEALEDSDDVQNVFANFDVTDEVMAALD